MTRARLLSRLVAVAPLLAMAACVSRPLPLAMAPVRAIALEAPLSALTVAVLDFTDERPDFERTAAEFDEVDIGGSFWANDRFFSFHADDATLAADPALPPDLRARVTGTGAFAWYPFPNPGVGKPTVARIEVALPDYLALHLEQRGIFARVIRARDEAAARAAGATLLLRGHVDRFGAMLAEARDPYVVRPDDWLEFRRLAAVSYRVQLGTADASADGAAPMLARDCSGRDEEIELFDRLNAYRGSQARPLYQLDADHFPAFALEDMATGTRRALERATLPLVAAIEEAMTAAAPAPEPPTGAPPP